MERLIEAVKNNDIEEVRSLLEGGFQPDFVNEYDFNSYERFLLKYVVEFDRIEILKLLLDHGGREYINYEYPRIVGEIKETLLHKAAGHGNVEIVKLLLDYGADANARDEHGETPLFDVVYICTDDPFEECKRYEEIVDLLLEYGADINAVNNKGNTAILELSLMEGSHKLYIEKLSSMGIDVDIANNEGKNMLMLCFYVEEDNFLNPIDLIEQSSIEAINAQDVDGRTPLMHAIIAATENENLDVVDVAEFFEALLEAGADINIRDNIGRTALTYLGTIYRNENSEEINEDLEETNEYVYEEENFEENSPKNRNNYYYGLVQIANKLVDYGLDFNDICNNEYFDVNFIKGMAKYGSIEAITYLFNTNNINNNDCMEILQSAILGDNSVDFIEKLIELGFDVNTKDNNGDTILMDILRKHSIAGEDVNDAIDILLQAGADINVINNKGQTPLTYIIEHNMMEIFEHIRLDFNNENVIEILSNAILVLNPKIIRVLKNGLIFDTIFDRIDFDNQENKQKLYSALVAMGCTYIDINNISNANKNALKQIIDITSIDFGEKINSPFQDVNTPMRNFINFGVAVSCIKLTRDEENNLNNIVIRVDNAVINRNRDEIKNSINELFKLCKTNQNIHDIIDSVIGKDVIYMDTHISLTKLLNIYGFNTILFDAQMQADEIFRRNGVVDRMPNNNEKSIINKSFDLIYRTILDEDFDILSQNEDINNACLAYQRNRTRENKQNLINIIIDNTNNEDKKLLANCLVNMKYFKINNKNINLATLISIITSSNLVKCLFTRLRQELQLNNVANANNALNNNQNQIE